MPLIAYERKRPGPETAAVIRQVNTVLSEHAAEGYDLTLRQLYYQFVAHDLFPDDRTWSWDEARKRWYRDPEGTKNADPNYKWLGSIVNDARMGGRIDWHHIVDRTRNVRAHPHWDDPADVVASVAKQFRVDLWEDQPRYVEVWIEKDALVGVIAKAAGQYDVPYFSCRGYTSQSEMWSAAQRLLGKVTEGKAVTILHLGDHDPSGIDMTRDIEDRLSLFLGTDWALSQGCDHTTSQANLKATVNQAMDKFEVRRIALNRDQVDQYDPPPNPAKMTDSRFAGYLAEHGDQSWELDALPPKVLAELVTDELGTLIEWDAWEAADARQVEGRELLSKASERWAELAAQLDDGNGDGQAMV